YAYVTGQTSSTKFPVKGAYQSRLRGQWNAFVTKVATDGNSLVYSTYVGGTSGDFGQGIAVDSAGSAYVVGATDSTDFPTQSAFLSTYQGGEYDAFVFKLAPAGNALAYSTYLGGSDEDYGQGIAVDSAGSA